MEIQARKIQSDSKNSIEEELKIGERIMLIQRSPLLISEKMAYLQELKREGCLPYDLRLALAKINHKHKFVQTIACGGPYSHFITVNANHDYPDPFLFRSLGHLLRKLNGMFWGKRWKKHNCCLEGFAVLERQDKQGGACLPHFHLLIRFSGNVRSQPNDFQLYLTLLRATSKTCAYHNKKVFDDEDIHRVAVGESPEDQERVADYLMKNVKPDRGAKSHDQWGEGLYHFNKNGLQKIC